MILLVEVFFLFDVADRRSTALGVLRRIALLLIVALGFKWRVQSRLGALISVDVADGARRKMIILCQVALFNGASSFIVTVV